MPLSEFLRLARGKLESDQQKPYPTDILSRFNDDLVELVWENGQIMMQGQSSRATRSPPNTARVLDSNNTAKIAKFGGVESILNDMSPVVPSGDLDISQDDEMVPWLSYPIGDALPQGYGSELLPDISGVTSNGISTKNSFLSVDKSSCDQTISNLHSGGNNLKGSSSKARPVGSWLPQHRESDALGSGASDVIGNNTNGMFGSPNNKSNLMNFSHFSRPVNLVKANNFPNPNGMVRALGSSGVENLEVKEKGGSNPVRSELVEQFNGKKNDTEFNASSAKVATVHSGQPVIQVPKELCPPNRTENSCRETCTRNDKPLTNAGNSRKGVPDGERAAEPMVATSSVGSGNGADRVSCEQTQNSKRKFRDVEEIECRSDDIETESVGVKKPTPARGGAGSKRSRAAEVHNLSERRRRDRINEKMRALQELIPNCNKADKASMLDEAIEYLKTLQLQVQIMSMGAGLCMPPMMFPGMQHMHPAHVPHFSPLGLGMGMSMGVAMGMVDMSGASPIFPVPPPMQVGHFPSPMPVPSNFQRIPSPNLPVYGHPHQGLPNSIPRPTLVPIIGPPPVTSAMGLIALRNGSHNEVPNASQILNLGNPMTHMDSQLI